MSEQPLEAKSLWHPQWTDFSSRSSGAFVQFRKSIILPAVPNEPIYLDISADTKYKLFINSTLVCYGPVKGDDQLWFSDRVDIRKYLKPGSNQFAIRVLRLYYASPFATSFRRQPFPGLFIKLAGDSDELQSQLDIENNWETSLDHSTILPTNLNEDEFLHIYEKVNNADLQTLDWVPAIQTTFPTSHGLSAPWTMSGRLIPQPSLEPAGFKAIHNVSSPIPKYKLEEFFLPQQGGTAQEITFPAGTVHHVELEASHHLTAMLELCFRRPARHGSQISIKYSEAYEAQPELIPYLRRKSNRVDTSQQLFGPQDTYVFGGDIHRKTSTELAYHKQGEDYEVFSPFHYRTLRFLTLDIEVVDNADLVLASFDLQAVNYPLEVSAMFDFGANETASYAQLWNVSVLTLKNCMHDCYEDCPFYEQLQYAMDTRSSIIFTYCISGDDRLARQAIVQLHNSYRADTGLTASRAPCHQRQLIPHFSLFWVCMVADHLDYFNDAHFCREFVSACDGVLEHFARRIDSDTGLVRISSSAQEWEFVDWTDSWRPLGIPPAASRTGFCTYTNMLYAYTLQHAARLAQGTGRASLATEYLQRADFLLAAIRAHCFDGTFFTDGLANLGQHSSDYSEHSQVWAVLCGATTGSEAMRILERTLSPPTSQPSEQRNFTRSSTAMSFYVLRALSLVGGSLYDDLFHSFWDPWRAQLDMNLTTWQEDTVSQRSDCHAWGCAALHEFTREVAGIRGAKPGWAAVHIQPRLRLFPNLDVRVPFGTVEAGDVGTAPTTWIAHVTWKTGADGSITLNIRVEVSDGKSCSLRVPPALLVLPNGESEWLALNVGEEIVRAVKLS